MTVTKFPRRFLHRRRIDGRAVWAQPEPPDEMVWEVCPYTRQGDIEGCEHCPQWEDDPDHGKVQRGCRAMAAEVCRIVMAMLKSVPPSPTQCEK